METQLEGNTLILEGGKAGQLTFTDRASEERVRAKIKDRSRPVPVRITLAETGDVSGHSLDTASTVGIRFRIDDDDTEGHAISVRFPTAEEADKFRRNLLAAGLIAGTIVVGTAGALAVNAHPANTGAVLTPTEQTTVYERPAGRGMLQGADIDSSASASSAASSSALDSATGRPARAGMQQGADIGSAAGSPATAPAPSVRPQGTGPLENENR